MSATIESTRPVDVGRCTISWRRRSRRRPVVTALAARRPADRIRHPGGCRRVAGVIAPGRPAAPLERAGATVADPAGPRLAGAALGCQFGVGLVGRRPAHGRRRRPRPPAGTLRGRACAHDDARLAQDAEHAPSRGSRPTRAAAGGPHLAAVARRAAKDRQVSAQFARSSPERPDRAQAAAGGLEMRFTDALNGPAGANDDSHLGRPWGSRWTPSPRQVTIWQGDEVAGGPGGRTAPRDAGPVGHAAHLQAKATCWCGPTPARPSPWPSADPGRTDPRPRSRPPVQPPTT